MSKKTEFTYPSKDNAASCHAIEWTPDDGRIRAVIQIIHGMQEYIERYEPFAEYLCSRGFLVVGEDHLGHGKTAATTADLGYFTAKNPDTVIVHNVHRLKKITQKKYPNLPYIMLGHSMGSFILRKYLCLYGKSVDAAILLGTGLMPGIATRSGIIITHILKVFHGDRYRSKLLNHAAFGAYNKKFPDARTGKEWLTRDPAIVDSYLKDPYCIFDFSLNGYRTLFSLVNYVCKQKNIARIPKQLPILIASGDADPVGNYGAGPKKLYESLQKAGLEDVTLMLYPEGRHELLHEINYEEIQEYLVNWVDARLSR